MSSGQNRIAVDWDGTCISEAWPEMGDWLPGAREALRHLLDLSYEVVINSTRLAGCDTDESTARPEEMSREILRVREMLDLAGLQEVSIWTKPWKVGALYYVDDKAIHFDGSWAAVRATIGVRERDRKNDYTPHPVSENFGASSRYTDAYMAARMYGDADLVSPDEPFPFSIRQFDSGATRNRDDNKPDFDGFISPLAQEAFGEYMQSHRVQADGSVRDSDNWQKGIPIPEYRKSLFRHHHQAWRLGRGWPTNDYETGEPLGIKDALCGVIFNAQGWLHEIVKAEIEEEEAA